MSNRFRHCQLGLVAVLALVGADSARAEFPYAFDWRATVTQVTPGSEFEALGLTVGATVGGRVQVGGAVPTGTPSEWAIGTGDPFEDFTLEPPLDFYPGDFGIRLLNALVLDDFNLLGSLVDRILLRTENFAGPARRVATTSSSRRPTSSPSRPITSRTTWPCCRAS